MAIKLNSEEFYTAAQTKEVLGITDGMLYNYVDNKALERVIPPGKKQGIYRRSQVDQLARELKMFPATKKKISSTFARATKDGVPECARISDAIFGAFFAVEKLEEHHDLCYSVSMGGEIAGYALFLPLKPEKMEKLLQFESFTVEGWVSD